MFSNTALKMLHNGTGMDKLSFGCDAIDHAIGKINTCGITELSGEAGCGKTQYGLVLSCQCQLSKSHGGLSGSVAYICAGEGQFPIKRLTELADHYERKYSLTDMLANVHVMQCYNIDDALSVLSNEIPKMCLQNAGSRSLKLLIIDSLAGLLRFEYDTTSTAEMKQRTIVLFQLAKRLKWIADTFKVAVVVINQVTATGFDEVQGSSDNSSMPALGLAWTHCVNTQLRLVKLKEGSRSGTSCASHRDYNEEEGREESCSSRTYASNLAEDVVVSSSSSAAARSASASSSSSSSRRKIMLTNSPLRESGSCQYIIKSEGIVGIAVDD